ncbi:MAG: S-layer homology domain-containing protein [Firmicutes bacterium]|nr:S-layer homology domain-containing protein [Bacillota bacterium]
MKTTKRIIILIFSLVLALSMACPAFAAQSYEIEDNIYPFYQMPANNYLVKITADEVKPANAVDLGGLNGLGMVDVYRCKGNVTIDAADCVFFPGLSDSFTYAKSLDALANNPYGEWLPMQEGTFTKPGAYLFVSTVSDRSYLPLPAKVKFVFVIEEGTTTPVYELKSFSDVSAGRWSHDAIMEMVDLGMFTGTKSPNANGVGEFDPTGTMTKAQFLVVATRHLYNDKLSRMEQGETWYANNYDVAVSEGMISQDEFPYNELNAPITRQEMALIAVRTAELRGEINPAPVESSIIADYDTIGSYYKDFVLKAFTMGLISGYDDEGTFGPNDTLTREQGAMVAYRFVNPDARIYPETNIQ